MGGKINCLTGEFCVKKTGTHTLNRLSDKQIQTLKVPGTFTDGGGLHIRIFHDGKKRWINRLTFRGRRIDIGLGAYPIVSLKKARERASENLQLVRSGADPRRAAKRKVPTFAEAAVEVFGTLKDTWENPKHAKQWISSLNNHVFPKIGDVPVDQIDTSHVLAVLQPLWAKNTETARRLKQRIALVLDLAVIGKFITTNPISNRELRKLLGK